MKPIKQRNKIKTMHCICCDKELIYNVEDNICFECMSYISEYVDETDDIDRIKRDNKELIFIYNETIKYG